MMLRIIFAPGFFQNSQVLNALLIGSIVALVSGVIGVFVIIRNQSFIGHSIADFGGAGAAISLLIGISTLWGFLGFGILAASLVELLGKRADERNIATGIILSLALGLEALFLYFDANLSSQSGATMLILFGSLFVIDKTIIPVIIAIAAMALIGLSIIYRPLLLSSVNPDVAQTKGVNIKAVSIIFIIILALVVEESSLIIGALLSTALLIGPAAAATRLTHKMSLAMVISALTGIMATVIGIVLAYDSYLWPPTGKGWPVSFFITILILLFYFLSRFLKIKRGDAK